MKDKRYRDVESFLKQHRGRMDLNNLIKLNRLDSLSGYYSSKGHNNIHSAIFHPGTLDFWVAAHPPHATRGKWVGFNLNKEFYGQGDDPEPRVIPALQ